MDASVVLLTIFLNLLVFAVIFFVNDYKDLSKSCLYVALGILLYFLGKFISLKLNL